MYFVNQIIVVVVNKYKTQTVPSKPILYLQLTPALIYIIY